MAGGTTNTQMHKTLKRILDLMKSLEDSLALYVGPANVTTPISLAAVISAIQAGNVELAAINSELDLQTIEQTGQGVTLDTIAGDTTSLDGKDFATSSLQGDMITPLTLIQSDTSLMKSDIDEIRISNGNIQLAVTPLEALIIITNTHLITTIGKLTGLDNNTDGLEGKLDDLLAEQQSTDQNWNLLSVNQLNLAAILTAVLNNATSGRQDSAKAVLDTIDSDTGAIRNDADDIRIATEGMQADIELMEPVMTAQCNRHYWLALRYQVTATGTGTIEFTVVPVAGDLLRDVKIEYLGITGNNTVRVLNVLTSAGRVLETIHTAGAQTAGTVLSIPENASPSTERQLVVSPIINASRLQITVTGVLINDEFEISINGCQRGTVVPVVSDVSGATVTITTRLASVT